MIVLDTDHLTPLKYTTGEQSVRLRARLADAAARGGRFGPTVVSVEEQFKGWLACLARERQPRRLVGPYRDLAALIEFFGGFPIAQFTDAAADLFAGFGAVHIKATDRKIAAIALANDALLLTANRRDFEQVPGLRFENWMD